MAYDQDAVAKRIRVARLINQIERATKQISQVERAHRVVAKVPTESATARIMEIKSND